VTAAAIRMEEVRTREDVESGSGGIDAWGWIGGGSGVDSVRVSRGSCFFVVLLMCFFLILMLRCAGG
jgi:hypothetical protein